MFRGNAYARALRGHLSASAAIMKHMIENNPGCLSKVSVQHRKSLHELLLQGSCDPDVVTNTHSVFQLVNIMKDLLHQSSTESKTGQLHFPSAND